MGSDVPELLAEPHTTDATDSLKVAGLIGVVTVLYNCDDVLPGFFASIATQRGVHFRLYVIDNGATDSGTVLARTLADQYGVDARLVFNNANVGVARGNNQGIELACSDGCEFVLLANNDTEFSPSTIRLLRDAVRGPEDRAATPKIMYFDAPDRLWYAGGHINSWTMRTPHYGIDERDAGQLDDQRHVGYAPTCFLMIAASVFAEIGRMDEQYFVYYDDTDFVWRMSARGIRIRFVPDSVVLHKVSSSTGGSHSPFSVYYTNRNRVYFIRKNFRGFKKLFAILYMLATRIPRLYLLPRALADRSWRGVADGFRMAVTKDLK